MTVTAEDMKATLRLWASGVTVVTTANDESRAGTTASSFTSVSVDPPLILVCLYHETEILRQIQANGYFAVSVLGAGNADVSIQMAGFANLPDGVDRFHGIEWRTEITGAPIFARAIGWLDCTLHEVYNGGTHKIVLGKIAAAGRMTDDAAPLLYFNRGYGTFGNSK